MQRLAYVMQLGLVPYSEALALQRDVAGAVSEGALPDTVLLLEHPPVITLGRRTEPGELHVPENATVEICETDRGGKSTYHGPGQLVCYPILDLTRPGQDVQKYCRDLDTVPFTKWITACGLEDAAFTTIATEIGRGVSVDDVRPAATAALADVFDLDFEPADAGDALRELELAAPRQARA